MSTSHLQLSQLALAKDACGLDSSFLCGPAMQSVLRLQPRAVGRTCSTSVTHCPLVPRPLHRWRSSSCFGTSPVSTPSCAKATLCVD